MLNLGARGRSEVTRPGDQLSALTLYFTITLNHCIELDNGTSSSLGIRSYITTGMRRALPGLRMEEVLTGGAPRLSP